MDELYAIIMETIKECVNLDKIMELDEAPLMALIGSVLDIYEANHEDFDAVGALLKLASSSYEIHKALGRMEGNVL